MRNIVSTLDLFKELLDMCDDMPTLRKAIQSAIKTVKQDGVTKTRKPVKAYNGQPTKMERFKAWYNSLKKGDVYNRQMAYNAIGITRSQFKDLIKSHESLRSLLESELISDPNKPHPLVYRKNS